MTQVEAVSFYANDEEGNLQEVYRLDAPEGGWQGTDELLDAYDQAVEDGTFEGTADEDGALELMAALSLPPDEEIIMPEDEEPENSFEMAIF